MSIFARQLQYVLEQHSSNLGQLYNIRVEYNRYDSSLISPGTITRLRQAVQGRLKGSATLNSQELEAVQKAFSFNTEEILRLRAALAAESIQRFLANRIELEKAALVGEALFQLLFDADDSAFMVLRNRMVKYIRGENAGSAKESMDTVDEESALAPAIEAYEHALLWLDTARGTQNPILRQSYFAIATSLLTSAQELLDNLPDTMDGTPHLAEWRQVVGQVLHEMHEF